MLRLTALFSGSKGNSYLIDDTSTKILVDAGRSARSIKSSLAALGVSPEEISAVLITHEHTDHVSALRTLSSKYDFAIYGASPVLRAVCVTDKMSDAALTVRPGEDFAVGGIVVSSCFVPHDSAACLSYRFTDSDKNTIAVATDMGYVTDEAEALCAGCAGVVIESNHDVDMLRCGTYPASLKARILSERGHLSNAQCADFAVQLAQAGCTAFALAHLSRENNTPEAALGTVGGALDRAGSTAALCAVGECGGVCLIADGGRAEIAR